MDRQQRPNERLSIRLRGTGTSTYLHRLGRFAFRRRRLVLAAWLAVVIGAIVLGTTGGGKTSNSLTIPGTASQQATDVLKT
jgi:RND superfamily putative drug exporter